MNNELQHALNQIHASDELKRKTLSYLNQQRKQQHTIRRPRFRAVAVACSMCILFICISGAFYFMPNTYVDMDINPSIELTLNRFGYVIQSNSYNEDGAFILNKVNIQYKSYPDAAQILLDTIIAEGYFKESDLVSITIQTGNTTNESNMLEQLNQVVSTSLESHHMDGETYIYPVTKDIRTHAHNNHVSPAKYLAISELQSTDDSITFEESSNHSVGELRELIEQHNMNHHNEQELETENTTIETQPLEDQVTTQQTHNTNNHDNH